MPKQSAVDIVFHDLSDALDVLRQAKSSPKDVRRAFSTFVELSQKLTGHMRKEFKEITRQEWKASTFDGWNDLTKFFKKLRNVGQHEFPITLQVHERQYYSIGMEDNTNIVFEGTWGLDDQLSNHPPEGMILVPADPHTGEPSETESYLMERREYEFHFYPSTLKLEEMLNSIGLRDIHLLSEQYFKVLHEYYLFYSKKIQIST